MLNDFIPISSYLAGELGSAIGTYENNYGISLLADSGIVCDVNCQNNCTGICTGGCKGTCSGHCSGGCKGTCSGSCSSSCTGNCSGSCSGGCETYCAGICQTYCQSNQTYSSNRNANNPGGKIFTWTNPNIHGETINISAEDWNRLASYIESAASYCSSSSISINRVSSGDPISADIFNNLDRGIEKLNSAGSVGTKVKNEDLLKDEDFNSLASNYNKAKIYSTLPANSSGSANRCCQKGMSCMTQSSGRPSLQPCSQSIRCNVEQ